MKRAADNGDLQGNRGAMLRVSFLAMKQTHTPHRSALTAIAAVLVLGSTPAIAQQLPSGSDAGTQAPVTAAPEIVIPSGQAAPAVLPSTNGGLAPITVAPPVAQPAPTISQAPIVAPAPAQEASSQETAPRAPERRATPQTAEPAARAVERQAATPAAPTPAPVEAATDPMPGIAPSDLMAMEQGESAAQTPPATQTQPAVADDSNMWAIVGGTGAVLLLGGAAYALQRRRKIEPSDAKAPAFEPRSARVDSVPSRPVAPAEAVPDAKVTPQFAHRTVSKTTPATAGDLESMAAAAPTAENPFVTRRNRLRRANFLLNHGQGERVMSSSEAVKAPEMATARQSQSQQSAQPVYSFGKAPVTYRPVGLKPSTT